MPEDPVKDQDKFVVRLPTGLRQQVKAAADEAGRSMNAEVIEALQAWLAAGGNLDQLVKRNDVLERIVVASERYAKACDRTIIMLDSLVRMIGGRLSAIGPGGPVPADLIESLGFLFESMPAKYTAEDLRDAMGPRLAEQMFGPKKP